MFCLASAPEYDAVSVMLPPTGTWEGVADSVNISLPGGGGGDFTTSTVLLWPFVGFPSGPGEVEVTVPLVPGTEAVDTTLPGTGLLTVTEQVPGEVARAVARLVPVTQVGYTFWPFGRVTSNVTVLPGVAVPLTVGASRVRQGAK
jgi:hypothetical protein